MEITVNHVTRAEDRKFLLFDSNKDLHVFFPGKNFAVKVASIVHTFKWHESLDVFVFVANQKTHCVYSAESLLLDKELFELCSSNVVTNSNPEIEFVNGNIVALADK